MTSIRFIAALVIMSFLMTGCLSGCSLCETGTIFGDKGVDHCYQKLAVLEGDKDGCDKIPGTGFSGSNPPKDKCYLMVAEKTQDPGPCANIEGGFMSYSSDECYQNVGAKGGSANKCEGLSQSTETECRTGVAKGQYSEGKQPDCGTGYTWVAGGVAGSCVSAPKQDTKETASNTASNTKSTTSTDANSNTNTDTTSKTTSKETAKTDPRSQVQDQNTASKGTASASPAGTSDKTTDKSSSDKSSSDKDSADKGSTDKSSADKPFWEKILDGISSGTNAVGDAAQSAADKAQAAADKVNAIFNGVDKNKNPSVDDEKNSRLSSALEGVKDDDIKEAIVKDFIKEKQKRDDMTIDQQKKLLDEIKTKHEDNKRLDDLANTLKSNTVDKVTGYVDKQIDKAKEQAVDAAKDKIKDMATGWIDKNAPSSVKDKIDKAQKTYDNLNDKMEKFGDKIDTAKGYYDKAKDTYDAVKETTDKINSINDKVASGAIDQKRARVLKGGVLLGKGLEKTTEYIPVFGDTVSTVTKETFGVAIKVATKKAERSTKLDDCFSDPANCDTDGISGY